jgi:predicted RNA-binding Zn-ribbon protein involved in translation (DUF1610 family)
MSDVKCLSCGGILFKTVLLDDEGNIAMDSAHPLPLTKKDNETYFKCPHCGIKNITIEFTSTEGVPKIKIINTKK